MFPSIPPEIITRLPLPLLGALVGLVVIIWLFQSISGIFKTVGAWRKDEISAASALRVERDKELRDAIAAARDARAAEAAWHGRYATTDDALRALQGSMVELGAKKDALARENARLEYRNALYEAFFDSPEVSDRSRAAWTAFRALAEQASASQSGGGVP